MNNEQAKRIMEISKKTYEMIAADFSATRNRVWPEMEILVKKYVKPGMKVLDLGCGNGRLLEVLPEVEYWGVDVSEGLVGEAEDKLKTQNSKLKTVFRVLDMLELEKLGEKNFDVVFMFASLNHIAGEENRLKVLEEIKKILKPGGVVVMTNWNMWQVGAGKNMWRYKLQFSRYKIQDTNKSQISNSKSKINPKFQIPKFGLGFRDAMTRWQSGDKKRVGELYYRAFNLVELRKLMREAEFEVVENYYSLDGKRACWWNGRNIVSVGKFNG
ncbi:class I SAM-dependent methyltransferase [Candidatus Kuenenbacteria bacterium]|nr:class I SAM-dependent methyltransferase [Candidatus Kuenenbacteria bacterium]